MVSIEPLKLADVVLDEHIQPRACGLDEGTVEEYEEAYRQKKPMPRPVAFRDHRGKILVAEGFHRVTGARRAGLTHLEFEVHVGGIIEARLHAAGSNIEHGLRRSRDDKRRAVKLALESRWEWTDEQVANHCGVVRATVSSERVAIAADTSAADVPSEEGAAEEPKEAPRGKGRPKKSDKAKIAAKVLKEHPEWTDAAVAEEAKCKPDVVKKVRRSLEEKGVISRKRKTNTKKSEELKDDLGNDVPEELRDLFGDPFLANTHEAVDDLMRKIKSQWNAVNGKGSAWKWLLTSKILEHLQTAEKLLKVVGTHLIEAIPHSVCPTCKGKGDDSEEGCRSCKNSGWLPSWRLAELKRDGIVD